MKTNWSAVSNIETQQIPCDFWIEILKQIEMLRLNAMRIASVLPFDQSILFLWQIDCIENSRNTVKHHYWMTWTQFHIGKFWISNHLPTWMKLKYSEHWKRNDFVHKTKLDRVHFSYIPILCQYRNEMVCVLCEKGVCLANVAINGIARTTFGQILISIW